MSGITPIVMPKWGLSMKEGTLTSWLVAEGASIQVGQAIMEVETDKIVGVVEAGDAGVLRRKVGAPGQTLPVKALLGIMAGPEVSDADIDAFVGGYVVPLEPESEEGASGSTYQFADVDGIRVRYARRGGGPRAALLLHGFGGDLDNWLFNVDALAEQQTVVALDLPGHGQSDRRLPGRTLADLGRFATRFLDAVEIPSAHVVGHSLGGAIAAQMALDHSDRVDSVALIASAGLGEEINNAYLEGFVSAQSRRDLKPIIEQLFAKPELVTRQLLDDVLKYKRLDGVSELLNELRDALFPNGRQREQPGRQLESTGKRILVLWGAQDRIIPAEQASHACRSATVRIIDGAGHMVQMEKAGEVNSLLGKHLAG
jgi:pyruvate dehydrogenase E2 component (dihydrolipoamide acetyltransferase)